jgi:hypothetical protein
MSPPSPYTPHPAHHPSAEQSIRRYNSEHEYRHLQIITLIFGKAHGQERNYYSWRMPPKHCRQGRRRGKSISFLRTVLVTSKFMG